MTEAEAELMGEAAELLTEARRERDQARSEAADLWEALRAAQRLESELYDALNVVTDFAATTIEKLGLRDTNGITDAARAALAKVADQ